MDLTPEEFEDLVGAYALDACDPLETEAMERYLAAHPDAAAEAERLREVAIGIAGIGASHPPVSLRERVLHAVADRVGAIPADEAIDRETDRLDRFLVTLEPGDLGVVTHNGLTVHELVQHLEAVDRAFVEAAADPASGFIGAAEVALITADDLPHRRGESFEESLRRFRRTRRRLAGLHDRLPAGRRVAGYRRDDTLVIRAFETWTHHDDIRRALGRELQAPAPEVVRTMAELAMRTLPLAVAVHGAASAGRTARLVLDGPGGGEWSVACAPGAAARSDPDVVVRTSVVDWCRRVADRLPPADLVCSVDGDESLARDLVAAASSFAGL